LAIKILDQSDCMVQQAQRHVLLPLGGVRGAILYYRAPSIV
jgi:hypothetical protein